MSRSVRHTSTPLSITLREAPVLRGRQMSASAPLYTNPKVTITILLAIVILRGKGQTSSWGLIVSNYLNRSPFLTLLPEEFSRPTS